MIYWEVRFLCENQLDLIQIQRTRKGKEGRWEGRMRTEERETEREKRKEEGEGINFLRGPGRIKI